MTERSWAPRIVDDVAKLPGWVHAAIADEFVFVAGMLGSAGDDFTVVPGGIGPETTQALENVDRVLRACGASLGDVVKVTVYLTDMRDFAGMEEAYTAVMGINGPPRTTVAVVRLGMPAAIEIECIAYRPSASP